MNNDLISRRALLDIMRYAIDDAPMYIAATVDQQITEAPAVDAEVVRHGRWVEQTAKLGDGFIIGCTFYKCSECGRTEEENGAPYCHCGAKMDGGKKNG